MSGSPKKKKAGGGGGGGGGSAGAGASSPSPAPLPMRPLRVLVFTRALEYVHASAPKSAQTIAELGKEQGFEVTHSDDPALFDSAAALEARFDVVVMSQTSGNVLDAKQLDAFDRWLRGGPRYGGAGRGRGFVGLHAAADTFHGNKWYNTLVGARFVGHPPLQNAVVNFDVAQCKAVLGIDVPKDWKVHDEIYNFSVNVCADPSFVVLAYADESSYRHGPYEKPEWNGTKMGAPHPLVWAHAANADAPHDTARSIYIAVGHEDQLYDTAVMRRLLSAAIKWSADGPAGGPVTTASAAAAKAAPVSAAAAAGDHKHDAVEFAAAAPSLRQPTKAAKEALAAAARRPPKAGLMIRTVSGKMLTNGEDDGGDAADAATAAAVNGNGNGSGSGGRKLSGATRGRHLSVTEDERQLINEEDLKLRRTITENARILLRYGRVQDPTSSVYTSGELIPASRKHSMHFILTDENVHTLYAEHVQRGLQRAGYRVTIVTLGVGEAFKTLRSYQEVCGRILDAKCDKHSVVISVGGGMVMNVAGFTASTIYRGLTLVHVPTTLMGQVDVAICVKQAVNTAHGKNLIGSIYTPSISLIDTAVLQTLPKREVQSGLAESIKHGLYQEPQFLAYLKHYTEKDLHDTAFLHNVVVRTARLKQMLFNSGEGSDTNMDLVGQYGHCVAHALEYASDYALTHGEAVAIGMCVTAEMALLLGRSDEHTCHQHYAISHRFGLPVRVPDTVSWDRINERLCRDKHYESGLPHISFLRLVGKPYADANGKVCGPIEYDVIRRAVDANRARRESWYNRSYSAALADGKDEHGTAVAPASPALPAAKPKRSISGTDLPLSPTATDSRSGGGRRRGGCVSFVRSALLFFALLSALLAGGVAVWFRDVWFRADSFRDTNLLGAQDTDATGAIVRPVPVGDGWVNWGRNVKCSPRAFYQPSTAAQVASIMRLAASSKGGGASVRVVGSGHSFTPITCGDGGFLLNLDRMNRFVSVQTVAATAAEPEYTTVTVEAGMRLRELNAHLLERGFSLGVLGAIVEQSVAGGMATATHGSSHSYGSLASLATGIEVVHANGTVARYADPTHPVFRTAISGIGLIGVLTQVTLRVEPAFVLDVTGHPLQVPATYFAQLNDTWLQPFDYSMAVWMPYADRVQPVTMTKRYLSGAELDARRAAARAHPAHQLDGYSGRPWPWWRQQLIFGLFKVEAWFPQVTRWLHERIVAYTQGPFTKSGLSAQMFEILCPGYYSTDSEYFVSQDDVVPAFDAMQRALYDGGFNLNAFYVVRYQRGDELLLSPCHGRASRCVALSFYLLFQGARNNDALDAVERALRPFGVRPHLGKMHNFGRDQLHDAFGARLQEFVDARAQYDPHGRFLNAYTEQLFT